MKRSAPSLSFHLPKITSPFLLSPISFHPLPLYPTLSLSLNILAVVNAEFFQVQSLKVNLTLYSKTENGEREVANRH